MTPQTTLFDAPVDRGTHRHADSHTSVAAAKAKRPALDQQRAFEALVRNGGRGSIDDVCAHFAAIGVARDRGSLSRRLTDLEAAGRIRKSDETVPGSRGRSVAVWSIVEATA